MNTALANKLSDGMNFLPNMLQQTFGANYVMDFTMAAALFVAVYIVLFGVKRLLIGHIKHLAKKTSLKLDDVIVSVLENVGNGFFTAVSLFTAVQHMQLPSVLHTLIRAFFLLMIVREVVNLLEKVSLYFISARLSMSTEQEEERGVSAAMSIAIRVVLWSVGLLLILSNLGFNVTSLVAGLGIGGLAVSLALQKVFEDVFSSFAILLDKPFEEGDYIVLGDQSGDVMKIGLKTTRIKTLQGEELVVSNTELTSTRINNFKKLRQRRIVFTVGATYETPVEKLKKGVEIIRTIIENEPKTELDRVHMKEMGDFSLNYEAVYYVNDNEYSTYCEVQQDINFSILEQFEAEGIGIAYPTQTVYVEKGE